jgi:adenylate kinase
MLRGKGLPLNAVIELKVDEAALLARIEKRAKETVAAGGTVRADDNPEAFGNRLEAYRVQTAPVSAYYAQKGELRTVDGMAPIESVTAAIDAMLGAPVKAAAS